MPKNPHDDADALTELNDKLKTCDPDIQNFVGALMAENLKLQKKIAKLQAEIVSKNNKIAAILGNELSDSKMEISDEERADKIAGLMGQAQPNHPPAANPQD